MPAVLEKLKKGDPVQFLENGVEQKGVLVRLYSKTAKVECNGETISIPIESIELIPHNFALGDLVYCPELQQTGIVQRMGLKRIEVLWRDGTLKLIEHEKIHVLACGFNSIFKGDRVKNKLGYDGTVEGAYAGELLVFWDNASPTFEKSKNLQLFRTEIKDQTLPSPAKAKAKKNKAVVQQLEDNLNRKIKQAEKQRFQECENYIEQAERDRELGYVPMAKLRRLVDDKIGRLQKVQDEKTLVVFWDGEPTWAFALKSEVEVLHAKTTPSKIQNLEISKLITTAGTQQRTEMNLLHILTLADALKEKGDLDPIEVIETLEGELIPIDGFHRIQAYLNCDRQSIPAKVRLGTKEDAILASCAANAEHLALPRTREDKRKAVETILLNPVWSGWSDNAIAKQVNVNDKTVAAIRKNLPIFGVPKIEQTNLIATEESLPEAPTTKTVKRGDTVYEMKTDKIGKKKSNKLDLISLKTGEEIMTLEIGLEIGKRVLNTRFGLWGKILAFDALRPKGDCWRINFGESIWWVHEKYLALSDQNAIAKPTSEEIPSPWEELEPESAPNKPAKIPINHQEIFIGFVSNIDLFPKDYLISAFKVISRKLIASGFTPEDFAANLLLAEVGE